MVGKPMLFRRKDVFIGHASEDDDIANVIIKALRRGGMHPFVDHSGIPIGQDWEHQLRASIRRAGLFVPLVSDAWLSSSWCQAEYRVARLLNKPCAPVVLVGRLTQEASFKQQVLRIDNEVRPADAKRLQQFKRLCSVDVARTMLALAVAGALAAGGLVLGLREVGCDSVMLPLPGMALIPGGTFIRGSADGAEDARPPRAIRVDEFYMDRREVSWGEFEDYLGATGNRHHPPDWVMSYIPSRDHPVVGVSWQAAQSYCAWKNKRLPREAEWERAARGAANQLYPWGDDPPPFSGASSPYPMAVDVASFDLSPQGVSNLMGNVREWVQDWYHADYYTKGPDENPVNLQPSEYRVVRGGSWLTDLPTAATRGANNPERPDQEVGFRCIFDPELQGK
jgi:formylglycine-generating enzyme required for sulfatase activity